LEQQCFWKYISGAEDFGTMSGRNPTGIHFAGSLRHFMPRRGIVYKTTRGTTQAGGNIMET
jgi:hypothetical protein